MEILIHPRELTQRWIDKAVELNIKRVSLHPVGGMDAHSTLVGMLNEIEKPEFKEKIDTLIDRGIEIGYEFHAASYLLPRELFDTHPEYFRMDEKGERTTWGNFCFSNQEALDIMAENAVKLIEKLYRSPDEYYIWLDDAKNLFCHCENCKKLSFADHQLNFCNHLVRTIRKVKPHAKICYIAYFEAVDIPKVYTPEEGVFLEYAPYERYTEKDSFSFEGDYLKLVGDLVKFFDKEDAKILEYWYDNSIPYRYSGKKLIEFTPDNKQIKADYDFYRGLGFKTLATFACNLDDDYVALFGEPDLSALKED